MTAYAAVIGHPVAHSLSPAIHNAAFAALGIDARYEAVDVAVGDVPEVVDRMRSERWLGMSVTMPHKEAVIASLDDLTPIARSLGAVNCVFFDGDALVGDNTDGAGVVWALRERLDVDPVGRRVVVLGAGGAARACIAALAEVGAASIVVVNRSVERAVSAAALAPEVGRALELADPQAEHEVVAADIVINATPQGMAGADAGESGGSAADGPAHVPGAGQVALDLVYHPLRTRWMERAEARGAQAANGVGMLVGQAAVAFERWTGRPAPTDAMWAAVADRLG